MLPLTIKEGIKSWDDTCDLDFRCPEAGRWPRNYLEAGTWAFRYGHDIVKFLKRMTAMHLPNCPECKTGIVVPLSDYSKGGTPIVFRAWACLKCRFEVRMGGNGKVERN